MEIVEPAVKLPSKNKKDWVGKTAEKKPLTKTCKKSAAPTERTKAQIKGEAPTESTERLKLNIWEQHNKYRRELVDHHPPAKMEHCHKYVVGEGLRMHALLPSQVKCLIPVIRENKIKYFAKSASTNKK